MLTECPQCGYSLRGLPETHHCPECGLAYDAASELFKHVNPKALVWSVVAVAIGGLWVLVNSASVTRALPGAWMWLSVLFAIFYIGVVLWIAWRFWRTYRRGPMVATMPDALWIRLDRVADERIRWNNISRAVVNRATKGATLFLAPSRTTRDIVGVFKIPGDAARFVEQVEARIAATQKQPRGT